MRIALHGSSMGDNFGDLLLLRLYAQWLRSVSPEILIVLPRAGHGANHWIGADYVGWQHLPRVKGLVYGPGGYLGAPPLDSWRWTIRNVRRHLPPALIATVAKVKWIVSGVGVGPLANWAARPFGRFILQGADSVVVRDVESSDYMDGLGLSALPRSVSSDAAFLLSDEGPLWPYRPIDLPPKRGKRIGIHVTTYSAAPVQTRQILEGVARWVRSLPESDIDIVVFCDAGIGRFSTEVYVELSAMLPTFNIINRAYWGPPDTLALLKSCDVIVTTKLHVGIVSVGYGMPVLAVGPHSKIDRLYRQLDMPELRIPFNDASSHAVEERLHRVAGRAPVKVPERIVHDARINRDQLTKFVQGVCR